MIRALLNRRVLLGVSGSIAAYKSVDLASKLTQSGALVDVVMTNAALEFVTPLTFKSVTHRTVMSNLFKDGELDAVEHISLAKAADILVIAPATANTLAKLANGYADDPVSIAYLATTAPTLIAPAMDAHMWENPSVQRNVSVLKGQGIEFAGPGMGHLASGLTGWGRLIETDELIAFIAKTLSHNQELSGQTIVVSAGGTQEPIDPVRLISNRSSGKMGYAIAQAARDRGAEVILIAAPNTLSDPPGIKVVKVTTAAEMHAEVLLNCSGADALVMAAAVADYRPRNLSLRKLKKTSQQISIELEPTTDIISSVTKNIIRVGFAAESHDLLENAKTKLKAKQLDLIVANDITQENSGFNTDTNKVTFLDQSGSIEELPLMSKYEVASQLLERISKMLSRKQFSLKSKA